MASRSVNFSGGNETAFNLTPVIDIVFLLIIFFAVVCKFIEAENFPVAVPANCDYAQSETDSDAAMTTISVVKTGGAMSDFAVGSEKVTGRDYREITASLTGLIDERLKTRPQQERVVTLRIDKDINYKEAQYALAAIAESTATDIRVSVLKKDDGRRD